MAAAQSWVKFLPSLQCFFVSTLVFARGIIYAIAFPLGKKIEKGTAQEITKPMAAIAASQKKVFANRGAWWRVLPCEGSLKKIEKKSRRNYLARFSQ